MVGAILILGIMSPWNAATAQVAALGAIVMALGGSCGGSTAASSSDGGPEAGPSYVPVDVRAANSQTCVLLADGRAACFGATYEGELCAPSPAVQPVATLVASVNRAVALAMGDLDTCFVQADGNTLCCGDSSTSTIPPSTSKVTEPTTVAGLGAVVQIAIGHSFMCALRSSGEVLCWGSGEEGELGDGRSGMGVASATPTVVPGISGAVEIASGGLHACARLADGTVSCWGNNSFFEVGTALGSGVIARPKQVAQLGGVKQLALGEGHTCALLQDGTVTCWGLNDYGQTGSPDHANGWPVPNRVEGLSGVQLIAASAENTCALRTDGAVLCFGNNTHHQLTSAAAGPSSFAPVVISGLPPAVRIAVGFFHVCALTTGADVFCWGDNVSGQTGTNGAFEPWSDGGYPAPVPSPTKIVWPFP